jgi:hypothetical protein
MHSYKLTDSIVKGAMVIVLREKILQINTGNGIDFPCS